MLVLVQATLRAHAGAQPGSGAITWAAGGEGAALLWTRGVVHEAAQMRDEALRCYDLSARLADGGDDAGGGAAAAQPLIALFRQRVREPGPSSRNYVPG